METKRGQLMKRLKIYAIESIQLSVLDFNERAIHVYEKCRFRQTKEMLEDNLNWVIMEAPRSEF